MRRVRIFGALLVALGMACSAEENGGGVAQQPEPNMAANTDRGAAPSQPAADSSSPGSGPSAAPGGGQDGSNAAATPSSSGMNAGDDTGGAAGGPAPMPGDAPQDDAMSAEEMAGECEESLDLENLMHSPGGNVLPHGCEPFDPTTNNPYAVRCIDAWPWYKTRFPGDEYCILPPPSERGVQFGVHPQGSEWYDQVSQQDMSGYENVPSDFLMDPGQEEERNLTTSAPNADAETYYRTAVRMRAGSHHMIVGATEGGTATEAWGPGSPDPLFAGTRVPGAQRPDENTPETLAKPPEDEGLFIRFPGANPSVTFNMHHFNTRSDTILKETWTNLWWEDDATEEIYPIRGLGDNILLSVQPGQTQDLHSAWTATAPFRVISLFGHRHAWTPNFSAWVERASGETEIVYQSFDWFDMPSYRYDSIAKNPEPNPELRVDAAYSGVLNIEPGDELHFNCHLTYTDARAAAEGAPSPTEIGTLNFANQAYTGEMCILFGQTTDVALGGVVSSAEPVPDFATLE